MMQQLIQHLMYSAILIMITFFHQEFKGRYGRQVEGCVVDLKKAHVIDYNGIFKQVYYK